MKEEAGQRQEPAVDEAKKLEYDHGMLEGRAHEGVQVVENGEQLLAATYVRGRERVCQSRRHAKYLDTVATE